MQQHIGCSRQLYYLGVLDRSAGVDFGYSRRGSSEQRSSEERLIDGIESAQQWGKLPSDWSRCRLVSVDVTKHGLKLTDASDGMVLDRIALFNIVQCVSYEDGFGHFCVVFLVQKPLNRSMQCYVFQTNTIADADDVCKQLGRVFNAAVK
uniref:PID domain-containing protein n=1 Tax=Setaria digitata TaxID=48799 RepID=A0A915PSR1_9BILA